MGIAHSVMEPIRQAAKGTMFENVSPTYVLIGILLIFKFLKARAPMQEYEGSKVVSITDITQWKEILKENKVVIADFYATWCPPCKTAAPIFGRWSTEWDGVKFVKIDVDVARDVAQDQAIRSMPTFKIFKDGENVHEGSGFNQTQLLEKLKEHGAKPAAKGDKKAE
jgi:thioredoxin 1